MKSRRRPEAGIPRSMITRVVDTTVERLSPLLASVSQHGGAAFHIIKPLRRYHTMLLFQCTTQPIAYMPPGVPYAVQIFRYAFHALRPLDRTRCLPPGAKIGSAPCMPHMAAPSP